MSNKSVSLETLLDKKTLDSINSLYKKSVIGDEYEVMFFNYKESNESTISNRMTLENYVKSLEYLTYRS